MKSRSKSNKGQSLVEYALGIGCVCAVAMVALSATGHIGGHIFWNVGNAINYQGGPGERTSHPEEIINANQTPWLLQ
jgi:hypothetical protein